MRNIKKVLHLQQIKKKRTDEKDFTKLFSHSYNFGEL